MKGNRDQTHASLHVCTYVQCSTINMSVYTVTLHTNVYTYILCTMHMFVYISIYSFVYTSIICCF